MRILTNTTSPYARIARIALAEKGFDLGGTEIVNPWADDAGLLKLNPASRVPTLELDSGIPLTESLLIVTWLERKVPSPSLLDGDLDRIISRAGAAMGVIDAMVHIMIGVLQMDPNWGETKVGLKRRRTIVTGLRALEADPPVYRGGTPDLSVILAVVAVDYIRLRFPDAPWREPTPQLDALRDAVAARPAFASTLPYV
ncbi:glutathione S-transferase family protein [Bradyrhizobium sp. STM 3809]|uniref:glutathione S-transferase family protein n=1 Tax=Bradyrhizobium sp. STM 3809 TaxID=551936 RepID=UPI00024065B6|nr:glutathione S-transferase family protein [Bradyrhizobium sp. STM 3809]CCD99486.1 putative glutathione S-transferase [Bradyrhizobium sp. STM 3809]